MGSVPGSNVASGSAGKYRRGVCVMIDGNV